MPGGDKRARSGALFRGFYRQLRIFREHEKLRGGDLLSGSWIIKINNVRNFLPWFLSGTLAPWSGSTSKGCLPSPQGGLRYCLLAKESCLLNFLGVKMQSSLRWNSSCLLPCRLQLGLHAVSCLVCKITLSDLKKERQHIGLGLLVC